MYFRDNYVSRRDNIYQTNTEYLLTKIKCFIYNIYKIRDDKGFFF